MMEPIHFDFLFISHRILSHNICRNSILCKALFINRKIKIKKKKTVKNKM